MFNEHGKRAHLADLTRKGNRTMDNLPPYTLVRASTGQLYLISETQSPVTVNEAQSTAINNALHDVEQAATTALHPILGTGVKVGLPVVFNEE
jgi:hypothetical protein